MGGSATAIDIQPKGAHTDPDVSLSDYTYDKLLEYWAMVYTLGLLAGVAGTTEEQEAAKKAVMDACKDAAEAAVTYAEAAAIAADDNSPPGLGAAVLSSQWLGLKGVQSIGEYFGKDMSGLDNDIANKEKSIRDSVAADVNQVSRVVKANKVGLEWLTKSTILPDYKADTSTEDKWIQATNRIVSERNAKVTAVLKQMWDGLKSMALARYNQFMSDMEKGGLKYALGTLAIDGAFLALELLLAVAAAALTAGAGAVVLKVSITIGKQVGKLGRVVRLSIKNTKSGTGRTGSLDLPEKSVNDFGKKHDGFGDDTGGMGQTGKDPKRDAGGKDVDGDAKKKTDDDDGTFVQPRKDIPCFEVPKGVNVQEFKRQLKEQQDTINKMTADEMAYAHTILDNARTTWRESGKKGSFTNLLRDNKAQNAARNKLLNRLKQRDVDPVRIKEIMSSVNATHYLDIIAGGNPSNVGIGGASENQRIGPMWTQKGRTDILRSEANTMRSNGKSQSKMNVGLSACD